MLVWITMISGVWAGTLRDATQAASITWPPPQVHVTIDKADHLLTVWSGDRALKHYRVGLGEPVGDKVQQGDMRTPVGDFRVVTRNPKSQFHLFLGLSYPNVEDAERGLRAGLVSTSQAAAIRTADRSKRVPPWNTPLGGAIGIHGGGGESDWTLGCIAVSDAEIEEIWEVARMGTRVVVRE